MTSDYIGKRNYKKKFVINIFLSDFKVIPYITTRKKYVFNSEKQCTQKFQL